MNSTNGSNIMESGVNLLFEPPVQTDDATYFFDPAGRN
jgi:hypothetical protein